MKRKLTELVFAGVLLVAIAACGPSASNAPIPTSAPTTTVPATFEVDTIPDSVISAWLLDNPSFIQTICSGLQVLGYSKAETMFANGFTASGDWTLQQAHDVFPRIVRAAGC